MDRKTKAMGFPVGSATLIDEVGIDVGSHIAQYMAGVFGSRAGFSSSDAGVLQEFVSKGFLGEPPTQPSSAHHDVLIGRLSVVDKNHRPEICFLS